MKIPVHIIGEKKRRREEPECLPMRAPDQGDNRDRPEAEPGKERTVIVFQM